MTACAAPHEDSEVMYRVVSDDAVRYYHGRQLVTEESIEGAITASFQPFDDRKNVHELDKLVGLTRLFRSVLGAGTVAPYPFLSAVRDTLTARCLDAGTECVLR